MARDKCTQHLFFNNCEEVLNIDYYGENLRLRGLFVEHKEKIMLNSKTDINNLKSKKYFNIKIITQCKDELDLVEFKTNYTGKIEDCLDSFLNYDTATIEKFIENFERTQPRLCQEIFKENLERNLSSKQTTRKVKI